MLKELIKVTHSNWERPRYFTALTSLCTKINAENGINEKNKLKEKADLYLSYGILKAKSYPFDYKDYHFEKIKIERK